MIEFITEPKDHSVAGPDGGAGLRWGVEPMCQVLTRHGIVISPSTYYEWVDKAPTKRQLADKQIVAVITAQREDKRTGKFVRTPGQPHDVDPAARTGPRRGPLHGGPDHARAGLGRRPVWQQAPHDDPRP